MSWYYRLEKEYRTNQTAIENMLNCNMQYISKTMFGRAYNFSPIEDESEVGILTKISEGDTVYFDDEQYDVKSVDYRLGLAQLDTDEVSKLINVERLEREVTPPSMCMGHLLELDGILTDYVMENLEEVSEIGYEIYTVDMEESKVLLGIPSVSSDATIELHTPLYLAWQNWSNKKFDQIKNELKQNVN